MSGEGGPSLEELKSENYFDIGDLIEWAADEGWSHERLVEACRGVVRLDDQVEEFVEKVKEEFGGMN